jgi:hypothetical protein
MYGWLCQQQHHHHYYHHHIYLSILANLLKGGEDGPPIVTGSKTEGALLSMLGK